MQKIISWTCVFAWMILIFGLSSQVAEQSSRLSSTVTEVVVNVVENVATQAEINIYTLNHIIRKNAHFFLYLVLGILAMNAFRRSGNNMVKSLAFSFLLCVFYAASDEIHQLYVPGRGAQVTDVLIDSSGACVGIFGYWFSARIFGAKRTKKTCTSDVTQ